MRAVTALLLATLIACAPAEESDSMEEAAPTAGPSLADFAGTWQNTSTLAGAEAPVASTTMGSADGMTWSMMLEGRDPIAMRASIVGDSLVLESDEYESVLREGVMVTVRTAAVMHQGMLMGNLVATYKTPDGDEVVTGTMQGARAPEEE